MLDKCPSDYRAIHLKMIREFRKLLERVEKEKMTADEMLNAYGECGGQYMKMGGSILEKYRLENCSVQFSSFLMRETEGLGEAERLKALHRIRKDILSGKLKIPVLEGRRGGWLCVGLRNGGMTMMPGRFPGTVPELRRFLLPVFHFQPGFFIFLQVKSCQGRGLGVIIRKFHNSTYSHESHRHLRQPE